jgi:AcrR family transcriptional regulator
MPRRSAAAAADTRSAIVTAAVDLASTDGLEGITIGRLADDLAMSKAGVIGPFGSKEALQLAALDVAIDVFTREVWQRSESAEPGRARLEAIRDAWIRYLITDVFPGGCFLTAASCEFDARGGPVRDAVAAGLDRWRRVLEREAKIAIEAGDLPADTDPGDVAFGFAAAAVGLDQAWQLHRDPEAPERCRRLMTRILRG